MRTVDYDSIVLRFVLRIVGLLLGAIAGIAYAVIAAYYLENSLDRSDTYVSYGQTFFLGLLPFVGLIGALTGLTIVSFFASPNHTSILQLWLVSIVGIYLSLEIRLSSYVDDVRSQMILFWPQMSFCIIVLAFSSLLMFGFLVNRGHLIFSVRNVFICFLFLCVGSVLIPVLARMKTVVVHDYQNQMLIVTGLFVGFTIFLEVSYLKSRQRAKNGDTLEGE